MTMGRGYLPGLLRFILTLKKISLHFGPKLPNIKSDFSKKKKKSETRVKYESPAPLNFYCSHLEVCK